MGMSLWRLLSIAVCSSVATACAPHRRIWMQQAHGVLTAAHQLHALPSRPSRRPWVLQGWRRTATWMTPPSSSTCATCSTGSSRSMRAS